MSVRQISVFLENKKGRLAEVTHTLARQKINIRALALADTADFGVLRIIVHNPERCLAVLKDGGFIAQVTEVLAVEVEDAPGGLAHILEVLDAEDVNVEYMYAFIQSSGKNAVIIFRFDNTDRAIEILSGSGYKVLSGEKVYSL